MYKRQAYNTALTTVDNAERMELLHQAEQTLVVDEVGMIPLYHSKTVVLYSDDVVSNVIFDANGKIELQHAVVTGGAASN